MFGNNRRRGDSSLDLYAAIEVVLAGGSELKAGYLTVSPGNSRGECSVSGSAGGHFDLVEVQFESLGRHAASLQPRLRAVLSVSGVSGGGRRAMKHYRKQFDTVQAFRKWRKSPEARALNIHLTRWRVHLKR